MDHDEIPVDELRVPADLDRAFAVADRLAVHGSDCVCPPCAGRLPGLLAELARRLG